MMIQAVFPYLRVHGAAAAIDFYIAAFGATERFRLVEPGGRIGHAELDFGPGVLMLSEAFPEYGLHAPDAGQILGASIHLHVADCDALTERAVQCGATLQMPPTDQFYGERSSRLLDPFGHQWLIGHEIEAVPPGEMQRRYEALFGPQQG
ncbi:MAG: VOC family protein [Burkholderiaceae bacterium]